MNDSAMPFILSTENVCQYLSDQQLICTTDQTPEIERRDYKNFNLWVKVTETCQYLVKQERFDEKGETSGDLAFEWRIQELVNGFPELTELRSLISELLLYAPEQSILVSRYFEGYEDITHFYHRTGQYPAAVAAAIGGAIATTHHLTWNPLYERFLSQLEDGEPINNRARLLSHIDSLGPDIFAHFCPENLEFFRVYQTTSRLRSAVQSLRKSWRPSCLIHRDLRLSNIVVRQQWADDPTQPCHIPVRIIDWEKFAWGDPAYDLGTLLAHYLRLWLNSLAIHRDLALRQALQLATIPLEAIQPSLNALVAGYLDAFPQVLAQYPDFLERTLQFTGIVLLEKVLLKLEHRNIFGNTDLCAMQVAQVSLNRPSVAAQQIFGVPFSQLARVEPCIA